MKLRKKLLKNRKYLRLEIFAVTSILKIAGCFRGFTYQNKKYHYVIHKYNATYSNERMVELPIIYGLLEKFNKSRLLEVGNVLSHYIRFEHEVLDKYEKDPKVTYNKDIISFKPKNKYDLVLSISTLEHVGFDERNKILDEKKIIKAIENILKFTKKKFIFTFPIGFNKHLDKLVFNGYLKNKFNLRFSFIRRDGLLTWNEIGLQEAKDGKYEYKDQVLVVGQWDK